MEGDNLVRLANELLSQLNVSRRIRKAEDIDSSFFVTLYEGLCGDRIPDVIRRTKSKEDEVHNCQCVIDSLAMDVLHTSLSHITGEDIVSHNSTAIYNLLEIFSGLMEFILHKIEKECSDDEGRPASTDSAAERGLQLATARGSSSRDGPRGKENAEKSGSPTSAIAAGVQRVLDEKQMQSPDRKRPRIDRDSSAKSSASRRLRKTPQPLLRPLASSSLQSIVIPSSSDTNYETDTTVTGAVSDRESRRDANRRASSHQAVASDLCDAERRRVAAADGAELSTKRKQVSSDVATRAGSGTESAAAAAAFVAPFPGPVAADAGVGARSDRRDRVTFAASTDADAAAAAAGFASATVATAALRGRSQPIVVTGGTSVTSTLRPPLEDASHRPVADASSVVPARADGVVDRSRQAAGADRAKGVCRRETSLLADQLAARMLATGESTAELIELANATFTKEEERRWQPSARPVASAGASAKSFGNSSGSGYPLLGDIQPRSATAAAAAATSASVAAVPSFKTIASAESRRHSDDATKATRTEESNQKVAAQLIRPTGVETSAGRAGAANSGTSVAGTCSQHFGSSEPDLRGRDAIRAEAAATVDSAAARAATRAAAEAVAASAGMASRPLSVKHEVNSSDLASNRNERSRLADADRRAQPTKRHVSFLKDRSSIDETSHVNDSNRRDAESPLWKGLREYVSCLSTADGATGTGALSALRESATGDRCHNTSHPKAATAAAAADDDDDDAAADAVVAGRSGGTRQGATLLPPSPTGGGRRLRARQVRFDQSPPLPSSALQTAVTSLERALQAEKRLDERRKLVLGKLYRNGLEEAADELRHEVAVERGAAERRNAAYQRQLRSMSVLKSRNLNVSRKDDRARPRGFLLPRERIIRPATECGQSAVEQSERAKSDEKTAVIDRQHQLDPEDDAFIPALLDEFPHLDVAPETIRGMWQKHWQAAKLASKAAAEVKRKKSRAQAQMEEAERKQRLLMNIMRKDIAFGQRMRQKKLQAKAAKEARHELQERRLKTARVRHYYDEYAVQTRSRMLRSRTREEQVFKDLFKKGLEIQKQRIRELRSYAKETRDARSAEQQLEIEALENYYQDQFNMLTESATKERSEWQLREQAQAAVLNKIKKEMRERMEKEIQRFQDQLLQGEDDAHFRQLDADRIQLQLKLTRLQTGL